MGNQGAGRPPKDGERYPSGGLKPEVAPAVLARMRTAVAQGMLDPKFGSQVGRLLMMRALTPAEAAAAFRIGEIYGRFETQNGLRRSTRSPSYESGVSTGGRMDVSLADDEQDARRRAIEEEWLSLQDELADCPREIRAQLEALCVEDVAVSSLMLPALEKILTRIATVFTSARRPKKKKKKIAALMLVSKEHRAAPKPQLPARRLDTDKTAWLAVQRKLSPHLDEAQLNEAYGIFTAMRDRETFRSDKQKKSDVNHDKG